MDISRRFSKLLTVSLLAASASGVFAAKPSNVLDLKYSITDSEVVFPESFESDIRKMQEDWYLKNYTATDDRGTRAGDVATDDATIKDRLAKLHTVIDLPFNQIVRQYIDRYTSRGREQVTTLLGLSIYYMPIFEQALEENGLPLELKYLPVIESALNPNAVSRHGATGLWQFMLATANGMGLEVSSLVDERRDPYVSSKAAAKYLKDLHAAYGDWSLAIAAYNCGPGTVNKAIRRAGGDPAQHDFWSIYNYLPSETRGYVPMFIAANYVMNYYPQHNISPVLPSKPLVTDTLMVNDRVHFEQISHVLDIPVDELRVLNPQFRADIIPGTPEHPYTLVLPSQQVHAYIMSEEDILAYDADKYARRTEAEPGELLGEARVAAEETLADNTPLEPAARDTQTTAAPAKPKPAGDDGSLVTVTHKVAAGETLADIADKYGVTTDEIKTWNSLRRSAVRTGQQLRITTSKTLAAAGGGREVASTSPRQPKKWSSETPSTQEPVSSPKKNKTKASKKKKEPAAPKSHTVKSGENLTTIAKKYGVTVSELRQSSGIKGDEIHPGDKIKLPKKSKASNSKSSKSKKKSSKKRRR